MCLLAYHVLNTSLPRRAQKGGTSARLGLSAVCTSRAHDVETNDKLQKAAAREEPGGERKLGEQGPGVKGNVDDG